MYAIREGNYTQSYLHNIHGFWGNMERAPMFGTLLEAKAFFFEYCLEMVRKGKTIPPMEFVLVETQLKRINVISAVEV